MISLPPATQRPRDIAAVDQAAHPPTVPLQRSKQPSHELLDQLGQALRLAGTALQMGG